MKFVNIVALVLVVVGAINWGLWGFFQFDLVAWACKGNTTGSARLIYSLVGLSGLWSLRLLCHCTHMCGCMKGKGKGGSCCK